VDLPPRRQIAVPSEERIDGLRAPSPEAALAEFRRSQAVAGAGAADSPDAAEAQEQQAGSPSEAEEPPAVGAKRVASSGAEQKSMKSLGVLAAAGECGSRSLIARIDITVHAQTAAAGGLCLAGLIAGKAQHESNL